MNVLLMLVAMEIAGFVDARIAKVVCIDCDADSHIPSVFLRDMMWI